MRPSKRVRFSLARNDSGLWGHDEPGEGLVETVAWRSTDIDVRGHWRPDAEPATRHLPARDRAATSLRPGDLLVTKASGSPSHIGKAALVGLEQAGGGFSNFMQRLTPCPGQSSTYLWWLLNSGVARRHYDRFATTSTGLKNINGSLIGTMPLPITDGAEQGAVSAFLDRECARLDALTSEMQALAHLLRDAASERVSRELSVYPSVALRFRLLSVDQGWSPECDSQPAAPGEWGVLKVGSVNNGRFRPEQHKRLPDALVPRPSTEIRVGDILMSRANTRELVGSAAIVDCTGGWRLMMSDKLYRLRLAAGANPRFVTFALNSREVRDQIEIATSGASSSMQNISQDLVRRLRIADGTPEAQEEVVRRLDESHQKTERTLIELAQTRHLLTEYRDALITEAVTGKLDVTKLGESRMAESLAAVREGERPEVLST